MLKHNLPETSSPLSAPQIEADCTESSLTEIETVSSDFIDNSIYEYLDQVMSSLVGTLHEDEISERRAEMRSHIVAMIDARVELGDSPEIALKETLAQFGQPAKLQTEWIEASENVGSFKTSFLKNLKFFGIQKTVFYVLLLVPMIASIIKNGLVDIGYPFVTWTPWFSYPLCFMPVWLLNLLYPLFIGFKTGFRGYNSKIGLQTYLRCITSLLIAQVVVITVIEIMLIPISNAYQHIYPLSLVHPSSRMQYNALIGYLFQIGFSVIGVSAGCLKRILKRRRQIAT